MKSRRHKLKISGCTRERQQRPPDQSVQTVAERIHAWKKTRVIRRRKNAPLGAVTDDDLGL